MDLDIDTLERDSTASESSLVLLARAKLGDGDALNTLLDRYSLRLRRWATGRLPARFRSLCDTQDLVQEVLVQTIGRLPRFEPQGEWALQAYLRQALQNRLRDEIRRARRGPERVELDDTFTDNALTPLEHAIGRQVFGRYEKALQMLSERDREAVIARVEMGCTTAEIAELLGQRTANAARMTVTRALVRLAEAMADVG